MICLLQRVSSASVKVSEQTIANINQGLLLFIAVERGDTETEANKLLHRILGYRVFADSQGKMNLSINEINGELLLVPQFTLAADTKKGTRPSFTPAADPKTSKQLFTYVEQQAHALHPCVQSGCFGADMQVALVNDGPVTFSIRVAPNLSGQD